MLCAGRGSGEANCLEKRALTKSKNPALAVRGKESQKQAMLSVMTKRILFSSVPALIHIVYHRCEYEQTTDCRYSVKNFDAHRNREEC